MSEQTWFVIAIIAYLMAMLAIGYWSYTKTSEYDDYVLGGRGLPPFVAALSAGASDLSGWVLMGLPGALFLSGLSELWIVFGLFAGAIANWQWVAPRLRAYSEIAENSITIPSFFENRLRDKSRMLRMVSAAIIIFFFTFYVSSGMVAGGRYFESTFDGDYLVGLLIVAAVTVAYTFVGGFLAVSYTDMVQGLMMFSALIIVPIMALLALDQPSDIFSFAANNDYGTNGVVEANPDFFNLFNVASAAGIATIIGNAAWGLGYFGQPHIIVRFMALKSPADAKASRNYGVFWLAICYAGATFVALIATVFFTQTGHSITDQDAFETVFLDMARVMFHPLPAGLVLTAVLAAIMSTMSSQLLILSSSLIEDIYMGLAKKHPSQFVLINLSRTAVVVIAIIGALLAVNPSDTILGLVGFAWAGFGSAFGPLVLFALYWKRLNAPGAIAGMITGAVVSIVWGTWFGDIIYEMVPGFIASTVALVLVTLATKAPSEEIQQEFDKAAKLDNLADAGGLDFDQAASKVK